MKKKVMQNKLMQIKSTLNVCSYTFKNFHMLKFWQIRELYNNFENMSSLETLAFFKRLFTKVILKLENLIRNML